MSVGHFLSYLQANQKLGLMSEHDEELINGYQITLPFHTQKMFFENFTIGLSSLTYHIIVKYSMSLLVYVVITYGRAYFLYSATIVFCTSQQTLERKGIVASMADWFPWISYSNPYPE